MQLARILSITAFTAALTAALTAPAAAAPLSEADFTANLTSALTTAYTAGGQFAATEVTFTQTKNGKQVTRWVSVINPDGASLSQYTHDGDTQNVTCVTPQRCWTQDDDGNWTRSTGGNNAMQYALNPTSPLPTSPTATYDQTGDTYTMTNTDGSTITVTVGKKTVTAVFKDPSNPNNPTTTITQRLITPPTIAAPARNSR